MVYRHSIEKELRRVTTKENIDWISLIQKVSEVASTVRVYFNTEKRLFYICYMVSPKPKKDIKNHWSR